MSVAWAGVSLGSRSSWAGAPGTIVRIIATAIASRPAGMRTDVDIAAPPLHQMSRNNRLDVPPLSGLTTLTGILPAERMREAGTSALTCLSLTTVVTNGAE